MVNEERYISSEVRFYSVKDVEEMTGWSKNIVLKIFNHPEFPAADFGKAKMVEAHALIDFFSARRSKADCEVDSRSTEKERKKEELKNELRKRMR